MSNKPIKFIQNNNKIPMVLVSESEYTSLVEENEKLKNVWSLFFVMVYLCVYIYDVIQLVYSNAI